jgi:penicillin-binding protein 1A
MSKKNMSDSEYEEYFKNPNKRKKIPGPSFNFNVNKKWVWGSLLIAFIALFIYIISGLPSLEELENPKPQLASNVYSVDGEVIGQFYIQNRTETEIDSLPKYLTYALISTEDRKFYHHWGVDLERVGKAAIKDIFTFSKEGASTITQQLAKNLYDLKSRHENIFETGIRKIREWISAVQIEKSFTKNEILQMYLNVSYFGRSAYGIESASRIYFDKDAKDLTLPEAAVFVAMLKSPEYYDPIRNYDHAIMRRNLVMHNMVETGYLSETEYDKLKNEPIRVASDKVGGIKSQAPYFMEYIRQKLEGIAEKNGLNLYKDGLNIYTSIDSRMQAIANKAVAEHLSALQKLFDKHWDWNRHKDLLVTIIDKAIKNDNRYVNASSAEDKAKIYNKLKNDKAFVDSVKSDETNIEAGFVCIDPTNGQIRAMVGGSNILFGRGLNHATSIRRQPGSSFKPFVYTVAIDNGYFPAYTILNQKFNYKGWSPSNSDGEYGGYVTMREALAKSINVVAGRMTTSDIALPKEVVQYAHKMGIKSDLDPVPSIALGTSGVTPLEMTSAYGTLDNHGVHVDPIGILKVEDRYGITIGQYTPNYTEAISPQTAAIVINMMQDVINYGTGAGVRRYFFRPAAGKTGTTQDFSDAWFVGFTPQLSAGVWVGFDDHRIKFTDWYGQGADAALPIWAKFMAQTYQKIDMPVEYFTLPAGVDSVQFCKETMDQGDSRVATEYCPVKVTDIVNVNHMPAKCNIHTGLKKLVPEDRTGQSGW